MKKQFLWLLTVCLLTTFVSQAQTFTSFKFTAESLGWEADEEDFEGVIDDEKHTITFTTQRWIEHIAQLPAIFEVASAEECEVKIGDKLQVSGETTNDFRKAVVYTIDDIQYTVKFVSPQATGIPVIKIETQGGVEITSKEDWTNMASFVLIDPNDESHNISKGAYSSSQYHRIRGRGNSTWRYPKKPYRIRFREDVSLFGKEARENWVLLAEYLDPTFLTTAVPFELGGSIFQLPFTCTYQPVNVYLNGRFDGLYTLTEHRQADPKGPPGASGRVGVDQANGGWFIEMDSYFDEDPKFMTENYELPVMIKAPEYAPDPTDSENPFYDFIKNDLNTLCDSMMSSCFPENGYRDMIEMHTFIDFLMVNEIVSNHELRFPKSSFAYKLDIDGKISMGPLWDFDWAFAYYGAEHRYFVSYNSRLIRHPFFLRFFDDPVFVIKYRERWNEKYSDLVGFKEFIDKQGEKIRLAALEDAKRWVIPDGYQPDYNPDHAQMVETMKKWWNNRVLWLDTEFRKVEAVPKSRNFGTITKADDYAENMAQTFTLVSFDRMTNLSAWLKEDNASAFEIIDDIKVQAADMGVYYAEFHVKIKNSLPTGTYNDQLYLSCRNRGATSILSVPLRFAITKMEQDLFFLDEVEEKELGDDNFFLTTSGGSGTGAVTFTLISGNAIVDEETGEVEITGTGDIVVVATKAEDDDYQQAISQELTITVNNPTGNIPLKPNTSFRVWTSNGMLHVTGIKAGDTVRMYDISGTLVFQGISSSGQMDIPLRGQGVYFVRVGGNTARVVNNE